LQKSDSLFDPGGQVGGGGGKGGEERRLPKPAERAGIDNIFKARKGGGRRGFILLDPTGLSKGRLEAEGRGRGKDQEECLEAAFDP